jgi:hypothetical protein
MRKKLRAWTRAIEKTKTTHWKEFLDSAREGHLWKAASFMARGNHMAVSRFPSLKRETEDKLFMETFFPEMAPPENNGDIEQKKEIPWTPIKKEVVYRALQATKAIKGPGEDEMPMLSCFPTMRKRSGPSHCY